MYLYYFVAVSSEMPIGQAVEVFRFDVDTNTAQRRPGIIVDKECVFLNNTIEPRQEVGRPIRLAMPDEKAPDPDGIPVGKAVVEFIRVRFHNEEELEIRVINGWRQGSLFWSVHEKWNQFTQSKYNVHPFFRRILGLSSDITISSTLGVDPADCDSDLTGGLLG